MTQASPSVAAGGHQHPWDVTADKINDVVSRLVAVASPLRLIVFGSAARGHLAASNDLDLLVVEPEVANRYSEMVRLQKALRGILIPLDLVVTSEAGYNERSQVPGTLEFAARTEGRALHDSL
jgi:predicted nucleotidyltransferase